MHARVQARRRELGTLFLESKEEFLTPTGHDHTPRHSLAASACIGEAPHVAAQREVLEETGVEARITELVGSYYNEIRSIGGVPTISNETPEVGFFPPEEALALITRPHFRTRLEDALAGRSAPYETFRPGGERHRLG